MKLFRASRTRTVCSTLPEAWILTRCQLTRPRRKFTESESEGKGFWSRVPGVGSDGEVAGSGEGCEAIIH